MENEDAEDGDDKPSAQTITDSLTNLNIASNPVPSTTSGESPEDGQAPVAEVYPMPETMIHPILLQEESLSKPLFTAEQLGVDRRLLVNRKRQLKMYRVWMQGQFRKPL